MSDTSFDPHDLDLDRLDQPGFAEPRIGLSFTSGIFAQAAPTRSQTTRAAEGTSVRFGQDFTLRFATPEAASAFAEEFRALAARHGIELNYAR